MGDLRVLHCINGMGSGGAEADIMNWYGCIHDKGVTFDFLLRTEDLFYKDEIEKMGGNIFITDTFHKHPFKNIKETFAFFKKNSGKYDAVHVHGNTLFYIVPLIAAKKYGIKLRIFHGHNTHAANPITGLIHKFNKHIFKRYSNSFVACSKECAKFFGVNNAVILKNAIDLSKFDVNISVPKLKRKLGIDDDKIVFTNIGRMLKVKNQKFLIDVFYELKKELPNSLLLIIGVGPLESEFKNQVRELGIENSVRFVGQVTNVNEYMKITDLLIFPSLYEGIPLTLLEAQASKTKILCSSNIDIETKITNYLFLKDLSDGEEEWASECIRLLNMDISDNISDKFANAGYSLEDNANKLYDLYRGS